MDIMLIVLGTVAVVIGLVLMTKFQFYKYNSSDTLFATKFKVFMSGLIITLIGVFILISEVLKLFK